MKAILTRLLDALDESKLSASDEEILAECRADGIDPAANALELRDKLLFLISDEKKAQADADTEPFGRPGGTDY